MGMSKISSGSPPVLPAPKSSDVKPKTTNSPSVKPHYRLPGPNGLVWPPNLPVRPQSP
jgi:hypothetical protein